MGRGHTASNAVGSGIDKKICDPQEGEVRGDREEAVIYLCPLRGGGGKVLPVRLLLLLRKFALTLVIHLSDCLDRHDAGTWEGEREPGNDPGGVHSLGRQGLGGKFG